MQWHMEDLFSGKPRPLQKRGMEDVKFKKVTKTRKKKNHLKQGIISKFKKQKLRYAGSVPYVTFQLFCSCLFFFWGIAKLLVVVVRADQVA